MGLASAVIVRFATEAIGIAAVFLGLAGITLAAVGYSFAAMRYRRVHRTLHSHGVTGSDGRALALLSLATLTVGVGCVVFIVHAGGVELIE